jgi:hypothetical protein
MQDKKALDLFFSIFLSGPELKLWRAVNERASNPTMTTAKMSASFPAPAAAS